MANIFPVSGQPFGMPNLNPDVGGPDINQIFKMIQQSKDMEMQREGRGKDLDMQRQLNLDNEMRMRARQEKGYQAGSGNLGNIAQSSMAGNKPMNVVYKDDSNRITPYQRESLDIQKQRLGQTGALGNERLDVTRRGQDISSARLDETIDVNNERQPNAIELARLRGDIGSRQIGERGDITSRQIGERGDITSRQIGERGDITSRQIGEREANLQARPITASQTGNLQDNKIRQLTLTRPDLAQYITQDTGGRMIINPDAPLGIVSEIKKMIYDESGVDTTKDIELPASNKTTSTTPKTSRYKVTIK